MSIGHLKEVGRPIRNLCSLSDRQLLDWAKLSEQAQRLHVHAAHIKNCDSCLQRLDELKLQQPKS